MKQEAKKPKEKARANGCNARRAKKSTKTIRELPNNSKLLSPGNPVQLAGVVIRGFAFPAIFPADYFIVKEVMGGFVLALNPKYEKEAA